MLTSTTGLGCRGVLIVNWVGQVIGCDTTVGYAVQAGQLELNVMMPVMAYNMNFAVTTHDSGGNDVVQQRFIRPQNADEYNPLPNFFLVTSTTPDTRGVGNFMRFDNLQPGPDGFPPTNAQPGAVAGPGYTPFIRIAGSPVVYSAPIVTPWKLTSLARARRCGTTCVSNISPHYRPRRTQTCRTRSWLHRSRN